MTARVSPDLIEDLLDRVEDLLVHERLPSE